LVVAGRISDCSAWDSISVVVAALAHAASATGGGASGVLIKFPTNPAFSQRLALRGADGEAAATSSLFIRTRAAEAGQLGSL
jgi:hypothetical protein